MYGLIMWYTLAFSLDKAAQAFLSCQKQWGCSGCRVPNEGPELGSGNRYTSHAEDAGAIARIDRLIDIDAYLTPARAVLLPPLAVRTVEHAQLILELDNIGLRA